jgi:hypothetical protein
MFQCLWKSCGKLLSTASGMQRHIRLVHLGCAGLRAGPGGVRLTSGLGRNQALRFPLLCSSQETGGARAQRW